MFTLFSFLTCITQTPLAPLKYVICVIDEEFAKIVTIFGRGEGKELEFLLKWDREQGM